MSAALKLGCQISLYDILCKLNTYNPLTKGYDIGIVVLSNNKEPRVKSFAKQVGIKYIYKAGKPKPSGYRTAMERLGTDTKNTLFVGDQIFTDIIGANLTGIRSILVAPIDPHEEIQIVLKRFIEKPVIACYKRHLKKVNK